MTTKDLLARRNFLIKQKLKNSKQEIPMQLKSSAAQRARMQKSANDYSRTKQASNTKKEEELSKISHDRDGKNTADVTAANTERKKRSTGKRKGSGLTPKSIYLHDNVHNQFEELAVDLGYEIGSKGLSSEQLSMLVQFLLDSYQKPTNTAVPLTKEGQYLYRVHQIVKYRSKTMNDTIGEIVEFMTDNKYIVPDILTSPESPRKNAKYCWTNSTIKSLLRREWVNQQIENINMNTHTAKKKAENHSNILSHSVIGLLNELEHSDYEKNKAFEPQQEKFAKESYRFDELDDSFPELDEDFPELDEDRLEYDEITSSDKKVDRDEDIFRKFSIERYGKILTEDEIFDEFNIEKTRLIQMVKTHILEQNEDNEAEEDSDEWDDWDDVP